MYLWCLTPEKFDFYTQVIYHLSEHKPTNPCVKGFVFDVWEIDFYSGTPNVVLFLRKDWQRRRPAKRPYPAKDGNKFVTLVNVNVKTLTYRRKLRAYVSTRGVWYFRFSARVNRL